MLMLRKRPKQGDEAADESGLVSEVDDNVEEEEGEDETGQLVAGDGITAPLLEFRASRWRGGRLVTPNVVRIWNDRIEEYEHHAVRHKNTRAINYTQASQVTVNKGLRWSNIQVESTGGQIIALAGVPKANVDQIKTVLDEKINLVKFTVMPTPPTVVDTSDRLIKLGEMRQAGLLTDEEFQSEKAKLLGTI
ncbi:MAG: SHOCT domain-containing protein [Acidimicrobiales bacterium]